jgi:hypothetical protein
MTVENAVNGSALAVQLFCQPNNRLTVAVQLFAYGFAYVRDWFFHKKKRKLFIDGSFKLTGSTKTFVHK